MELEVLYKSENFLVINKPYDIIINSIDDNVSSVHKYLSSQFPELINPKLKFGFYFPHRLDYATSGVLCIALNKKACTAASNAFHSQTARKLYLALLRGHVSERFLKISVPIGEIAENSENRHGLGKCVRKMSENGERLQEAKTELFVLSRGIYNNYPATKVLLKPLTGRRHQLRVHTSILGHTIIGDYTYSCGKDTEPSRMFLHAYSLFLPNDLETLEIKTRDCFEDETMWKSVELVSCIEDTEKISMK